MCLYSTFVDNPRYKPNNKNGGIIPPVNDIRTLLVPTGCGKCIECRKQRARNWQVRLLEDIKENNNGIFTTLTFNTESIIRLKWDVENYTIIDNKRIKMKRKIEGYDLDNAIATRAMRMFNERWRKKTKKAVRHWMVTELGHQNTEHVHLHGIIYTNEHPTLITDKWNYGFTWLGDEIMGKIHNYVNEATVNYITKYVSKQDFQHTEYKPIILSSPGIGNNYIKNAQHNQYNGTKTDELYRTSTGHKINMPPYWRNKIYTDNEREKLWIQQLNKNERYICGEKVTADNDEQIHALREYHRQRNKELGYGDNAKNWDKIEYEKKRRIIIMNTRIKMHNANTIKKTAINTIWTKNE